MTTSPAIRSSPTGYVVSLAAVTVAVVARLLLEPLLADRFPFITLFLAVGFAAWYGGKGPGLLALVAGAVAAAFFLFQPRYSFAIDQSEYRVGLVLYGVVGLASVAVFESLRKAHRRAEEQRRQLEQEVAARRAAEQAFAEQAERLRTTLASIGDAVITTDTEGRVTNMNAAAEVLTGWTSDEAAGRPLEAVFRVVNETTRKAVENPATRALREGVVVGLANHTLLTAKDGTERPVDGSASPIRCKDGEVVGCVLVFRDITERKRAEDELRRSEARFRAASEAVSSIVWTNTAEGMMAGGQPGWGAFTGQDREGYEGYGWSRAVHPDDAQPTIDAWNAAVAGKKTFVFEHRVRRTDGQWRLCAIRAVPVFDGRGEITEWVGVHTDITDRKQAEDALRRRETFTSGVLGSITDGFFAVDKDWRFTFVNDQIVKRFGLGRDEIMGGHVWQTFPAAVGTEAYVQLHRAMAERTTVEYEVFYEPLERWFSDKAFPTGDGGLAVYTQDVTDRKGAEQRLRAGEARFRELADAMPQIVYVTDAGGKITFVNRQWLDYTGQPDAQTADLGPVVHPDDLADVLRRWELASAGGTPLEAEFRLRRAADGEYRWFLTRSVPIRDGGGRVVRWYGTSTDIHDQKRTEAELRDERGRLAFALDAADLGQWDMNLIDHTACRTPRHDRIFGYDAPLPEWTYETFLGHVVPDDRADVDAEFRAAVANGTVWDIECRVRRADGAERHVWTKARVQRDAHGRVERMLGIVGDQTDRKRTEAALQVSEGRQQLAMTAARMVAFEFDPATGGVVNSDNAPAVFGLPPGAGLGDIATGFALLHPDDRDRHRAAVEGAVERAEGYVSRFRIVRPDTGAVAWMEEHGHAVGGPGGAVRLVGIVMDVTARHEAEADRDRLLRQVVAERGQLADVFRQAPAFLAVLRGPSHVVEMANDQYDRLVGHRDILGKPIREALPEVVEQGFLGLLDGVYRTGQPFVGTGVRVLLARQPGQPPEERYVDFVYQALRDPVGTVTGVVAVGVDVTDRREAERAVERLAAESERQRRLFDTALSNTTDYNFLFDLDGRLVYANKPLLALWGRTAGDALGKTLAELDYPADADAQVSRNMRRVIETGEAVRDETPYTGPTAVTGHFEYIVAPVLDADGRVVQVAGSSRDITARKRMEEELRRLAADLSDADRRKDEFLATLAHELRNPLAPIRNGLQVIKLAGANGTVEQARSMMDRQLTQLVRLVDDLLDISRVTQEKLELRRERVEVRAVIDAAVETSRPLIEQAGHAFAVAVPDEPVFVDGDATRLAQVVSNLLTNSAKYTHRGGRISLTVRRDGGAVAVSVADDGIGIPPAMLDKVFVMFTQVDRTLEKTTGGLGIGLSLVKGLVEMHGGTIEARSEGEGRGSEFVVTLPVAVPVAGVPDATSVEAEDVVPSGRRILVVDDNVDAADSLAQLLEMLGNEVHTANDGEAGVEAAAAYRPDLILMDIGMPKLNGYEAARGIRQQPRGRGVVLVALTGWGQEDDRQKSSDAGFDFHLVKPVEFAALMKLLAALPASPADR